MDKFQIKLIFLVFFTVFLLNCNGQSQNLALNKPYLVTPKPNDSKTKSKTDMKELTDGKFSKKTPLWNDKVSVGWRHKNYIQIDLDLERIESIGELIISTAARESRRFYFPENIFVFVSNNGWQFEYVGDVMSNQDRKAPEYTRKKLKLEEINKKGRFISLVIIPNGKSFSADEIEVFGSNQEATSVSGTILKRDIFSNVVYLKRTEFDRENQILLKKEIKKIAPSYFLKEIVEDEDNDYQHRFGKFLRDKFEDQFIISSQNPWSSLSELFIPGDNPSRITFNISAPVGGVKYVGFSVTNTSEIHNKIYFKCSSDLKENITVYEAPFIPYQNGQKVIDALIKVKESSELEFGSTKMFLIEISPEKEGENLYEINISNGEKLKTINIKLTGYNVFSKKNDFVMSVNPYARLTVFNMTKDRIKNAALDLENHHVNVISTGGVIPAIESKDFGKLKSYLKNFSNSKYILIRRSVIPKDGILTTEWKEKYLNWSQEIIKVCEEVFPNAEVYFYLFDEIRNKDFLVFKELLLWSREVKPDLKYYATLNTKENMKAFASYVDIAQTHLDPEILAQIPDNAREKLILWFYFSVRNSRIDSPYKDYRLRSWLTYSFGGTGLGFWSYASGSTEGLVYPENVPMNGPFEKTIIYNGPQKTIYSSRRWEAFKLGVEDFEILQVYEKQFGKRKTLEKVKEVIDFPDDYNKADMIIAEMLEDLYSY